METNVNEKAHWENIYETKKYNEVSWYQAKPKVSLDFIEELNIPKTARIIDVGGGDSVLVDCLLELGYQNITVLDISATAIEKAKIRLKEKADNVTWVVSNITDFAPKESYDLWHDRAAFHFLTETSQITSYRNLIQQYVNKNGVLVMGTFSEQGPKKCSGIAINQYSPQSLTKVLSPYVDRIKCMQIDHQTPFDTTQNFTFCSFRRKNY